MEAGQRAAGDGDEQEREQGARERGAVALDREGRDGGHLQRGLRDQDADGEQHDGADLHERRQVVARRQQQPHRQHRGGETVGDRCSQAMVTLREREPVCAPTGVGDPAAGHDGEEQQHDADQRDLGRPCPGAGTAGRRP